jgi:hypothetical protein
LAISVLVAPPGDALALAVERGLASAGHSVRSLEPDEVGDVPLTLSSGYANGGVEPPRLAGDPIGAVLWRTPPDGGLTHGWSEDDCSFADAEVRSAWLAVLDHPSTFAVNRFGADLWFEGAGWPASRRRLREAGLELAPLGYGAAAVGAWLPYRARSPRPRPPSAALRPLGAAGVGPAEGGRALGLFGRLLPEQGRADEDQRSLATASGDQRSLSPASGDLGFLEAAVGGNLRSLAAAAVELDRIGIHLAMLFTDPAGRLQWVDPLPVLGEGVVSAVATEIVRRMHAHLRGG